METTTIDLSWLCGVALLLLIIPVIYYGIHSRMKYAKQLLGGKAQGASPLSTFLARKPKTRFREVDEFYKAINVLIEWLKREGYPEDAQKLDTLMNTSWTTSSELLGEIMLALKSMQSNYPPELRKEINECYEFALHHQKLGLSNGGLIPLNSQGFQRHKIAYR